jgi:D-3-phosphoglycerate dehydrogenase
MPKIAFLTPTVPALRAEMLSFLPSGFEIEFVQKNEKSYHRELLKDADYVFLGATWLDNDLMESAPQLKMIQKWGIGVDKIDIEAARTRGIPVAITNGANAVQVAEHAILLMLATLRRLTYAQKSFAAGQWINAELRTTCFQLSEKTVGLFGFGNIAKQVAKQLSGFHAQVLYYSRQRMTDDEERFYNVQYVDVNTLFSQSDILSLHAPLNAATFEIVNQKTLSLMKPSAIVINTARGELINEKDLVHAINEQHIFGAGLDVFVSEPPDMSNPLFILNNVVVTPHAAASVKEVVTRVIMHGLKNIALFDQGLAIDDADWVVRPQ